MFDEDGSLDPFLKFLLCAVVLLGVAKTLWAWLTDDVARWFSVDVWHWITGFPWWSGLSVGALLALVMLIRRASADGGVVYAEPYEPVEDPEPVVLTYRMKQLSAMTPTGFEHACAEMLARDGFHRPLRVGGAGDLGADVVAYDDENRKLVLQCKKYARPVGSKEVQRFNGTARPEHGADLALIIGLNGFTQPAIDFAQRHNLTLIGRHELKRWAHGEHLYSVLTQQNSTA
ncbi:restriction endonuclease [Streptomyces acidicola]|uniref:restriction endonuclease n=1 Tax=Streptomyces acidicola TaxID=2596892 RepID=UPI0038235082